MLGVWVCSCQCVCVSDCGVGGCAGVNYERVILLYVCAISCGGG